MSRKSFDAARRRTLHVLSALVAALLWRSRGAVAQSMMNPAPGTDARMLNTAEGVITTILGSATMQRGRVKLELPTLAENGRAVPLSVSVESAMTDLDYVRSIDLVSEKNPVPHMATFHLGPRAGRAEVGTRVRLNGTQRVTAIAHMSDGGFWYDTADIVVNEPACTDGS